MPISKTAQTAATDEAAPLPPVEPECSYPVETRLQSGVGAYHVDWPASTVRAVLADELKKVRVSMHGVLGHGVLSATRYVLMGAVAKVVIHNRLDEEGQDS